MHRILHLLAYRRRHLVFVALFLQIIMGGNNGLP